MIAFVLSGGGSRGGLQSRAILALLDRQIRPDLIVGTSVGAINGAVLAASSLSEGARRLAERWQAVTRSAVFPGNPANVAWRLLARRPSFYANTGLYRFILGLLPRAVCSFADLQVPLLVTATNLHTGAPCLFGDDPRERLVDALMAGSAIPPYLPPWHYRQQLYVDGGVVAHLPISVALERGATTIYALEIGYQLSPLARIPAMPHTVSCSIRTMLQQQVRRELAMLPRYKGAEIHQSQLLHYSGLPHEDFSHGPALLELGYQTASAYLDGGAAPESVPVPRRSQPYALLGRRLQHAVRQRSRPALRSPAVARVVRASVSAQAPRRRRRCARVPPYPWTIPSAWKLGTVCYNGKQYRVNLPTAACRKSVQRERS